MKRVIIIIYLFNLIYSQTVLNTKLTYSDRIQNGIDYNDLYGFRENNKDYIIICQLRGFAVYEVQNNGTAKRIGANSIVFDASNSDSSIWGEPRYYKNYIYKSTEAGPIRIYKINWNNETISYMGSFNTNSHNIQTEDSLLFACGGSNPGSGGVSCYSIANPENPLQLWSYDKFYVHDLFVQNRKMYLAELYNSSFAIYDIAQVNGSKLEESNLILRNKYANGFTHNIWATPDGNYLVTTDEHVQFDHVQVWDVSDPLNVKNLLKSQEGTISIVHNAFIKNNFIYMSYYDRGLVIYDMSDKQMIVKVGEYDSYPQGQEHSNEQFQGAWGTYPFLQNNYVAISDISNGLFIVEFDTLNRAKQLKFVFKDKDSNSILSNYSYELNGAYKRETLLRVIDDTLNIRTGDFARSFNMKISKPGYQSKLISRKAANETVEFTLELLSTDKTVPDYDVYAIPLFNKYLVPKIKFFLKSNEILVKPDIKFGTDSIKLNLASYEPLIYKAEKDISANNISIRMQDEAGNKLWIEYQIKNYQLKLHESINISSTGVLITSENNDNHLITMENEIKDEILILKESNNKSYHLEIPLTRIQKSGYPKITDLDTNNTEPIEYYQISNKIYALINQSIKINFSKNNSPLNIQSVTQLSSLHPNPFNPTTNIQVTLIKSSDIKIQIFNSLGQKINELQQNFSSTGTYNFAWNATNFEKQKVSSGIYFIKIQTNYSYQQLKAVLIK